ncbi:uncharacterized protein CIMG_08651 [Coccidioides immitis RS]|uniref:Uncharacterized protein n=1 Tax=Coccidioides immitis (strain RS) TaxID=246410 RepID=J3K5Y4_COCIM|nr:uncharacterized protein CIMG_08651 [Coccidioides immitis RS]EAS29905.3 hypothetical protein CIMG_08651 [Coccidioides immitis RS]
MIGRIWLSTEYRAAITATMICLMEGVNNPMLLTQDPRYAEEEHPHLLGSFKLRAQLNFVPLSSYLFPEELEKLGVQSRGLAGAVGMLNRKFLLQPGRPSALSAWRRIPSPGGKKTPSRRPPAPPSQSPAISTPGGSPTPIGPHAMFPSTVRERGGTSRMEYAKVPGPPEST